MSKLQRTPTHNSQITAVAEGGGTLTNTSTNNSLNNGRLELNPRLIGYVSLIVFSLAAITSIIFAFQSAGGTGGTSLVCLGITLAICTVIVVVDLWTSSSASKKARLASSSASSSSTTTTAAAAIGGGDGEGPELFTSVIRCLDMKNATDQREKYVLLALCLCQIIAVISTTKVNGIAYQASNIYLSVWVNLVLSLRLYDDWLQEKNEICFHNLTHLSGTLRGWYGLTVSSTVVFGSVLDGLSQFLRNEQTRLAVAIAIVTCSLSIIIAMTIILSFYKLCLLCSREHQFPVRGWWELLLSLGLAILWLAELLLVTQFGSFGATTGGGGVSCSSDQPYYPGSNVYYFSWISFAMAAYTVLQWKAERALEMAKTTAPTSSTTNTSQEGLVSTPAVEEVSSPEPTGDSDI